MRLSHGFSSEVEDLYRLKSADLSILNLIGEQSTCTAIGTSIP